MDVYWSLQVFQLVVLSVIAGGLLRIRRDLGMTDPVWWLFLLCGALLVSELVEVFHAGGRRD